MAEGISNVRGSLYPEDDSLLSENVNLKPEDADEQAKEFRSQLALGINNLKKIHRSMIEISEKFSKLLDSTNPLMKEIADRMEDLTKVTQQLQVLEASIGPVTATQLGFNDSDQWPMERIQQTNSLIQQIATVVDAQKSQWSDKTKATENTTQTLKDFLDDLTSMTKSLNELFSRLTATVFK